MDLRNTQDNITAGIAIIRQRVKTSPSLNIAIASYYQGQYSLPRAVLGDQPRHVRGRHGVVRPGGTCCRALRPADAAAAITGQAEAKYDSEMAKKSNPALLSLFAFAALAVLGGLIFQTIRASRVAASPLDDKAKEEWIEGVVATPRPPCK